MILVLEHYTNVTGSQLYKGLQWENNGWWLVPDTSLESLYKDTGYLVVSWMGKECPVVHDV